MTEEEDSFMKCFYKVLFKVSGVYYIAKKLFRSF